MSYLFKYKINYTSKNIMYVGFPKRIVQKIKAILEQKKINYLLIDTRNNYDVDEKADNKNLNQYNTILCNAEKYIKIKRRIDKIRITLVNYNGNVNNNNYNNNNTRLASRSF